MTKAQPSTVDEYLAQLPKDVRDALQNLRQIIRSVAPESKERIAYRIPVVRLRRDLVGFSAQRNPQRKQCSFYTMSPPLVKAMKKELKDYNVSGATIHFTPDEPLPALLVRRIVRARVKELSEKG
jgi:uncharacterized protein YdhG (YjbR/CyaY superfamily)